MLYLSRSWSQYDEDCSPLFPLVDILRYQPLGVTYLGSVTRRGLLLVLIAAHSLASSILV